MQSVLRDLPASTTTSGKVHKTTDELEAERLRAEKHYKDRMLENAGLPAQMNIPARFKDCTFGTFKRSSKEVDAQIESAIEAVTCNQSVYIHGPVGTGKTHFAVALMYEAARIGMRAERHQYGNGYFITYRRQPKFYEYLDILMKLKSTFDTNAESERSYIASVVKAGTLIVIDDIGVEKTTEWTRQSMFYLIDKLYSTCKPFIITSNLSIGDLAQKVDDRIASRIAQGTLVVKLTGEDYRLNK